MGILKWRKLAAGRVDLSAQQHCGQIKVSEKRVYKKVLVPEKLDRQKHKIKMSQRLSVSIAALVAENN